MKMRHTDSATTRPMAEPVAVPGFPSVIVTREFLYGWLASLGWNKSDRGFGSMDYLVFGRPASTHPLDRNC